MGRIFKWLVVIVLVLVGAGAALYFTGGLRMVIVALSKPDHGWDPARKAPDPDYAKNEYWAARPDLDSFAKYVPEGVTNNPGERDVDVFFVHPTGFLNGSDWNSPLNPMSRTEENTKWMMANQASAFNGCCNVFAPRYREASIFAYFTATPDVQQKAMDFAYADVERAFDYFLEHYSKGRPFIIASHSQGTSHALRLVQNRIDGTPLADRMVAAYLIGSRVTNEAVNALKTVKVCNSENQTGCLIHWAVWGEGGSHNEPFWQGLTCVNPLNWQRDGARAPASAHKGGVPITGQFSVKLWGDDSPANAQFPPLKAPVPNHTWAECQAGFLVVADQGGGPFGGIDMGGKNYHGLDYPLFHMDIRENAKLRVAAYLAAHPAPAGAGPPPSGAAPH